MLLQEYKIQFAEELQKIYDEKEVESFFYSIVRSFSWHETN
ncbi:hypothetical protein [Flavobacterium columnare]|nr:hypothetical protein [Flavobacterium columnare]